MATRSKQRTKSNVPVLSGPWTPLLLALIAFAVYWPSLKSEFVYDGRIEILDEGFVTNLANLPSVLSFKVLGMNTMLAPRPGDILYLMLISTVSGTHPFGYHLCNNFLHATNVALVFVLLRRLVNVEGIASRPTERRKVQLAIATVTLIFALHPIAVEPVAEISYSADLLVTFFTLLALLAATAFHPANFHRSLAMGGAGTICAFAAVTCKESGVATALILVVYWLLFRRREARTPWFLFLGSALTVTAAFFIALVLAASPELQSRHHLSYLGGSVSAVFWIQPRLWIFMLGKLIWPTGLAGQYMVENLHGISILSAQILLVLVVALQAWLATQSRLGALGVAVFWLGLATVSNFVPLFLPIADRFYYLPLAGVAMQLLAVLLLLSKRRALFWIVLAVFMATLVPFTLLTVSRQSVFASELSFWRDTAQKNPGSATAHDSLGIALALDGQIDRAIDQFQDALALSPRFANAHEDLAHALFLQGHGPAAIEEFQRALLLDPSSAHFHYNLGCAFREAKRWDEAIDQFKEAIRLKPDYAEAKSDLAATNAAAQKTISK